MSTLQYYRLCLLQYIKYHQDLTQLIKLQGEIAELRTRVASHQKKHRRCDREIEKEYQCNTCQKRYASEVALKLHLKLKHSEITKIQNSFERINKGESESIHTDKENKRVN